MKNLMFIALLLLTIISFSKADKIKTKEPKVISTTQYYTVYCIENYKWLKFNGCSPQQMFEIHRYSTSVEVVSLPVSCN